MRSAAKRIVEFQPNFTPVPYFREYEVADDYHTHFYVEVFERGEVRTKRIDITIPKNFRFDGASVPAFAWQLTFSPFDPLVMLPALIHDYLHWMPLAYVTRRDADRFFRALLLANGVGPDKAELMYKAVRVGGAPHWHTQKEAA